MDILIEKMRNSSLRKHPASTLGSAGLFIKNAAGTEGRHPRFVANWGQARLHDVAPVSSLLEPGRVGAACAARPFFQGGCHA
ncbi:hypothetical protein PhaeoP66_04686 (plasmid) [Phaeobacter inhibens]|uniref:Uncharacterized protein n=1 Tax=Phaeobacter inhibens TaxID=221822 RepID=A0ABM6RLW9_9RHOB|nr:hypothetical protein PhaeoP66_01041 [Phaeobacter inhibens]AUQ97412.1 hypothetical protein PhaeoP66_04686 [Phaeobacter inhibens]